MAGVGDTDRDTKLRLDGGGGSDMARKEATRANHKLQPRMLQVIGTNRVELNNGSVSSVSLTW